jgi:thioredoxin 2
MRGPSADPDKLHVVCPGCGQRVRFARQRLNDEPRCPSCKHPLLPGVPVTLDQTNLDRYLSLDDLPMLVDFWAPWCGPCTSFAPVVGDIASDFKRTLRVGKVDTDASPALGSRFGIRSIPTIALFKAGGEIARQSGALPKSALLAWLGEHGIVRDAA